MLKKKQASRSRQNDWPQIKEKQARTSWKLEDHWFEPEKIVPSKDEGKRELSLDKRTKEAYQRKKKETQMKRPGQE